MKAWLSAWAVRVYTVALVVCPRVLRRRYGADMVRTFEARGRDAMTRGPRPLLALLAREIADLAVASIRARRPLSPIPGPRAARDRRTAVNAVWQDVRYAVRMLARQPGFTLVAILTLALGIGATTAVFTVVDGVLVRPLPYRDPDRLLLLLNGRNGRLSTSFSPMNYRDVTQGSGVFSDAAAMNSSTANLTGHGDPQRLDGADVTWTFFSVVGTTPAQGRAFVESDQRDGARVVVISDGLWRQLGARADMIGATLQLDSRPSTVVGIAAPEMTLPGRASYWRPLVFTPHQMSDSQRGAQWVNVLARLKPGVDLRQANGAVAVMADQLARKFPRTNEGRQMSAVPLQERVVRGIRPALLVLLGAVALVLLIACVNVANLLLARAYGRTREVVVRAAVGAGRTRLVQQFLVESLVLGATGALGGLFVAVALVRVLIALGPASIPRLSEIGVDWRALAFTAAMATATSLLFGLVPALAATGDSMARAAWTAGRGSVGHGGSRLRRTLVVCETALAAILLVGAGLLLRSFSRLSNVNPGFSAEHVLTFTLALPEAKYPDTASVGRFIDSYVGRLAAETGVESAAAVFGLPLDGEFSASSSFTRTGEVDTGNAPSVGMRLVTPDYLRTLKIPLREGRFFDAHDDAVGPEVVVINEEAARRFWPGINPIGQQIHLGVRLTSGVRSGQKAIVGIVGDIKYEGLDAGVPPEVYLPYAQHPVDELTIAVRTAADPMSVVPVARADLAALDRELPIARVATMDEIVGRSVAERRLTMLLLGGFAAIAVVLAAGGIYGVLAFLVGQRTQEIGVRLALGATPGDVVRLFVREGVGLMLVGLGVGAMGALAATRLLTTLLFGVTTTDPATFVGVAATLGAVGLAASYVPARRAAAVDPMSALRAD